LPTQTLQIPQFNEVIEIPVNRAHFNGTTSIDLFFEDNHGNEEETEIGFLAFKGEWVALSREAVSIIYEAAANPRDHALMQGLTSGGQQSLGQ
jgi:PITH domain